jgi:hypothetical protein
MKDQSQWFGILKRRLVRKYVLCTRTIRIRCIAVREESGP